MSSNDDRKEDGRRWILATYHPASLFSLRTTYATNKGGKTLLVPTPYAVKLALVDACFRACDPNLAEKTARRLLDLIKGKEIRFSPPEHCIVENTFVKVKQKDRESSKGTYTPTIAYRELCFFSGDLVIALEVMGVENDDCRLLIHLLRHVNYFGKRGSFFQFIECKIVEELPPGFSFPDSAGSFTMGSYGTMQALDDLGEADTHDLFDRINTYRSDKSMTLGKHRVLINTFLPYRMVRSSRNHTYYRRDDS